MPGGGEPIKQDRQGARYRRVRTANADIDRARRLRLPLPPEALPDREDLAMALVLRPIEAADVSAARSLCLYTMSLGLYNEPPGAYLPSVVY